MAGLTSLATLEGTWSLTREIQHGDGKVDHLKGTVKFSRTGRRLIQQEDGMLTLAGTQAPLRAERRYIWTLEAGRIEIFFEDMRPFHTIPVGVAEPATTYLCPPDRYEVTYDFNALPKWRSVWEVEGPRKTYRMESHFAREDV